MITIIENGTTNISYTVQLSTNGKINHEYTVNCKAIHIDKNGKTNYAIFDNDGKIITDAFKYLNFYLSDKTNQTKQKNMVALKYLYSYCTLFSVNYKKMTKTQASAFTMFMAGRSINGNEISFKFNTVRAASSVNDYLSCIRSFLKYMNISKHPLLDTKGKKALSTSLHRSPYTSNLKTMNRKYIPPYIHQDEFVRMIQKCRETGDLRMECIIRLMYQSGLRIGEVLGLTFEDIIEKDGNYQVVLRNRITDKTFQKAKFLMTITDKNQYKSSDYKREWYGWNSMAITSNMYECLMDYIEQAHVPEMEKHYEKWKSKVKTDIVSDSFNEKDNFYVFINSHHTPLSNKTLENEIKKLFIECDIPINYDGGKTDGLAHRFRHGFAMYQVNVNGLDKLPLSKLMRHRSVTSCETYYTPEMSDIIHIKDGISKAVYELLPEFEENE